MTTSSSPQVTVLMSVWNASSTVVSAIDSILAQSYSDFEFLIIDDASTDDSLAKIQSKNDPRIRILINEENLGLTRSLNKGLSHANGSYVARMDSDDLCHVDRLSKQVAFLDNHPEYALVGSWYETIDPEGCQLKVWELPTAYAEIQNRLPQNNCFCHGSVMMRRETVLALGGYNEKIPYAQDYDLWLRLSEKHKIANIPDCLYFLRMHPVAITSSRNYEQTLCVDLIKKLHQERMEHGTDSFADESARKRLLKNLQEKMSNPEAKLQHYISNFVILRQATEWLSHENQVLKNQGSRPVFVPVKQQPDIRQFVKGFLGRLFKKDRETAYHIDQFDGFSVTGWAFARDNCKLSGVILLNSEEVGRFSPNIQRPDVADAHPGMATAGSAGFHANLDLSNLSTAQADLTLRIEHDCGITFDIPLNDYL